ncbi:MAG: hypothetical protein FWG50_13505 [Kiritimatiellaeota bacterium]|nr:hypothetical protein [Kiritimatiellota bacterium]
MPNHDLILKPGEEPSETLRSILDSCFNPTEVEKLLKYGGIVRISIKVSTKKTSSKRAKKTGEVYLPAKEPVSKKNQIEEEDMVKIEQLKDRPEQLEEYFSRFSNKALFELCTKIGLPISKNSSARKLKVELITTFRANEVWNKIAGYNRNDRGQGALGSFHI